VVVAVRARAWGSSSAREGKLAEARPTAAAVAALAVGGGGGASGGSGGAGGAGHRSGLQRARRFGCSGIS